MLQIVLAPTVGTVAHRWSLTVGIILIALLYFMGFGAAMRMTQAAAEGVGMEVPAEAS
jgi:hypothetical protein